MHLIPVILIEWDHESLYTIHNKYFFDEYQLQANGQSGENSFGKYPVTVNNFIRRKINDNQVKTTGFPTKKSPPEIIGNQLFPGEKQAIFF